MDKDIEMKREHVRLAYTGDSWTNKVNAMSDKEVLAVYKRLLKCGKIRTAHRR